MIKLWPSVNLSATWMLIKAIIAHLYMAGSWMGRSVSKTNGEKIQSRHSSSAAVSGGVENTSVYGGDQIMIFFLDFFFQEQIATFVSRFQWIKINRTMVDMRGVIAIRRGVGLEDYVFFLNCN